MKEFTKEIAAPVWQKITPSDPRFDRGETMVAGYVLTDYVSAGEEDCTPAIQALLDRLGELGGGALYIPAGEYACQSAIKVPCGVTLFGDWEKPDGKHPIAGTVLVWRGAPASEENTAPFVALSQSSAVRDLAVWYPDQSAESPVAYPPAIRTGFWATAKELTLINPWIGVEQVAGDSPNMHNIYGTPIHMGIKDEVVSDIMRIESVHFSPDFWLNSGRFTGSEQALRRYLRTEAVGVLLQRIDWSYFTDSIVDGYYKGMSCHSGACYGQCHNLLFTDCHFAVYATLTHGNGELMNRVVIRDCDYGLYIPEDCTWCAFMFSDSEIDVKEQAISLNNRCKIMMVDSRVTGGTVYSNNGMLILMNNTFDIPDAVKVDLTDIAAVILAGNDGIDEKHIRCTDKAEYKFNPDKVPNDATVRMNAKMTAAACKFVKQPANTAFVSADVLSAKLGLSLDACGETDTAATLNACLAELAGKGGILYLPAGIYRLEDTVHIPAGVELCGAEDFAQMPMNNGTRLHVAHFGHGIEMSERSGLKGVTFCYPEQTRSNLESTGVFKEYDFAVWAKDAADLYIVNVATHNTYNGIWLEHCDRHYVDGYAGLCLNRCIVAKDCTDGIIRDAQFNWQSVMRGHGFPDEMIYGKAAKYVYEHTQHKSKLFTIDNVTDEMIFGCFTYGGSVALAVYGDDTTATTVGLAGDYVTKCVDAVGGRQIDMINTQMTPFVYCSYTFTQVDEVYGYYLRDTFKGVINVSGIESWTVPEIVFVVEGGTLNVSNINSGNAAYMHDTYIEHPILSRVEKDGRLCITGFLQYSPLLGATDDSVVNCAFCGSKDLWNAENTLDARE